MNAKATSVAVGRKVMELGGRILKTDGAKGEVVAVVNTGLKDKQGDTVLPGAWSRVIREGQTPALCWQHNLEKLLGSVTALEELRAGDPRLSLGVPSGLLMTGRFALQTQMGHDAFVLVSEKHIREWSVQFSIAPDGEKRDGDGRKIREVEQLFEISPVIVGASLLTGTLSAKSAASRLDVGFDEDEYVRETRHELALIRTDDVAKKVGFDYGYKTVKGRLMRERAMADCKRRTPEIVERISKEFLDGEREIQRNNLRMGIEYWGVDHRKRERLEAVVQRVSQKAFSDAYRAVEETA